MRPAPRCLAWLLAGLWLLVLETGLGAQEDPRPVVLLTSFRQELGSPAPELDPRLVLSSQRRAQALDLSGTLSHQDDRGRGPGLQMVAEGLPPGVYGEVLGAGPDWDSVWKAWLNSPTHREILADPDWTRWGWGRSSGDSSVFVLRFWHP